MKKFYSALAIITDMITGAVVLIALVIGFTNNNFEVKTGGFLAAGIGLIIGLLIANWFRNGNKCPECGQAHALSNVGGKVIDRSNSYSKKVGDKYLTYEKVTYLVTRRCKFCSHEIETTRTHEECLNDDIGVGGAIGQAIGKKIRKY